MDSQYIKTKFIDKNEKPVKPKSPATFCQVLPFNDISIYNYLQGCSYSNFENFELSPEKNKIVSGIQEGNESKFLEIPVGYEANMADELLSHIFHDNRFDLVRIG
jgi:hypothetical protein